MHFNVAFKGLAAFYLEQVEDPLLAGSQGWGRGGYGEHSHFGRKRSRVEKEEKKLFSPIREETLVSF